MTVIRWVLGRIILLVDFLYRPKGIKRDVQEQAALDAETAKLSLYQYAACPFCVKVRWSMKRQSLNIETRDAKRNAQFADELVAGGGALKVPCLRIEEDNGSVTWMYESSDILTYLDQRFDLVAEPS
ncbi:glutaredoxin [Gammaproteobacteria bacterium 42_54_T18]|nr:glutaredoxin [Gammaproteobacteria bacterium 42_54_T18]